MGAEVTEVLQISAPHFCAAVVLTDGKAGTVAPILKYMQGWAEKEVIAYANKRQWDIKRPDHDEVIVHTDGSCWPNDGKGTGGWAFVMRFRDKVIEHYGHETPATNNTMELMAVFRAMQRLNPTKRRVNLCVDSQYAINCITTWTPRWARNGWRTADGEPVKNQKLLEQIAEEKARHPNLRFIHVRGHRGNADNERADILAHDARVKKITNWKLNSW